MRVKKWISRKMRSVKVRHVDSGEAAIGYVLPGAGCVVVQFNRIDHPQSHGWYVYPRHHFRRRRGK